MPRKVRWYWPRQHSPFQIIEFIHDCTFIESLFMYYPYLTYSNKKPTSPVMTRWSTVGPREKINGSLGCCCGEELRRETIPSWCPTLHFEQAPIPNQTPPSYNELTPQQLHIYTQLAIGMPSPLLPNRSSRFALRTLKPTKQVHRWSHLTCNTSLSYRNDFDIRSSSYCSLLSAKDRRCEALIRMVSKPCT